MNYERIMSLEKKDRTDLILDILSKKGFLTDTDSRRSLAKSISICYELPNILQERTLSAMEDRIKSISIGSILMGIKKSIMDYKIEYSKANPENLASYIHDIPVLSAQEQMLVNVDTAYGKVEQKSPSKEKEYNHAFVKTGFFNKSYMFYTPDLNEIEKFVETYKDLDKHSRTTARKTICTIQTHIPNNPVSEYLFFSSNKILALNIMVRDLMLEMDSHLLGIDMYSLNKEILRATKTNPRIFKNMLSILRRGNYFSLKIVPKIRESNA